MLTDVDKEFDTPIEDENGELIETIEIEEVFEEDTGLEEKEDSFYEFNEEDLSEEDSFYETEEAIVEAKENYKSTKEELVEKFTSILEKGEITAEDNVEIELLKEDYSEAYNSIKENVQKKEKKTLEERLDELKEGFVGATSDEILNILTDGSTKCWLYKDDDGNVLIDSTSIPELTILVNKLNLIATDGENEGEIQLTPEFINTIVTNVETNLDSVTESEMKSAISQSASGILSTVSSTYQTKDGMTDYSTTTQMNSAIDQKAESITNTVSANYYSKSNIDGKVTLINESISKVDQKADKISWVIKSGTNSSNMELTEKMYSLMTEKVLIDAKKIELNGSININDGLFRVLTNGNTKIGGDTGNTVEGYNRALLEITSNGNLFSVSPDSSKVYTKLSEGTIKVVNSSYTLTIDDSFTSSKDVVLRSSLNSTTGGNGGSVWLCCNGGDIKTEDSRAIRYFKNSDGNYVFRPNSKAGVMYVGTATYPIGTVISKSFDNLSDRSLKENIRYISNSMHIACNPYITVDDCYNFMKNDLPITLYNYLENNKLQIGFVAQDVIYNSDKSDNKVGQMIVNMEPYMEGNEDAKLSYDMNNVVGVTMATVQKIINIVESQDARIKNLEGIINGSN